MLASPFEVIRRTVRRCDACTVCGRRVNHKATFRQTLSPWNRNPDGTVKTRTDAVLDVIAQAEAWRNRPARHRRCAP